MPTVLVVDNDASMRHMLELALRSQRLEVIATACPEGAEEALAAGEVGAMLLDYHLGAGVSGATLLQRWAALGDIPPFWLVTGMPDQEEVNKVREHPSCQGVVAKPFAVMRLVAEVAALCATPTADAEAEA